MIKSGGWIGEGNFPAKPPGVMYSALT